jgi:phosphoribosylanthranilate isomerase
LGAQVKICGVKNRATLDAVMSEHARWVGFVFHPASPRHIEIAAAAELARHAGSRIGRVGLFVDPTDAVLEQVLAQVDLDFVQLHGAECPARVADIARNWKLGVIKAVAIASEADIVAARTYAPVADWILFDAKPPVSMDALPGGNGVHFDWALCQAQKLDYPWMLSGGLDPGNVAQAIHISGAGAVDVSSGVEFRRGEKSPELIRAFIKAAHSAPSVAKDISK